MLNIRKVLFPTDFSPAAEAALPTAVRLAELHGAELHILHGVVLHADDPHHPSHQLDEFEEVGAELVRIARERLGEVAAGVADAEIEVVPAERRAISPSMAILDYAQEEDVDLVVMGTHGRRGFRRLLLGSVAEEVLRVAGCAVVTVREPMGEPEAPRPIRRILVPVDFSAGSRVAVAHAAELAREAGAELHLLHVIVVEGHPDFYFPLSTAPAFRLPELREEGEDALLEMAGGHRTERVQVLTRVEVGRPADEIVAAAESLEADLICMSSHGRTGLERTLLGSVTEGVARKASCPVLVVKGHAKSLLADRMDSAGPRERGGPPGT